jgi:hypothetical protein
MKGLRNFNVAELAEAAGVPRGTAARYLTDLRRGGYVALVERSGPDRLARWLLIPRMDTGLLSPSVRQKDKAVFDRNLGRMVEWRRTMLLPTREPPGEPFQARARRPSNERKELHFDRCPERGATGARRERS